MTDADKTAEKLTASIRKTKAGAAGKPATPRKATPKRATSTRAKTAPQSSAKTTGSSGVYQVGRRVWPD